MSARGETWAFPTELQPRSDELGFDLDAILDSMVLLRVEIPPDAFTAPILGTERSGYGAVIRDDGLVLTIGYLITEASAIWITTNRGMVLPGHALAYDQATGFGLVQPLGRLGLRGLERGSAAPCRVGDPVLVVGHGGRAHALKAEIMARREFAGYWEYVLDDALFTVPAHPQWGGSALIDSGGRMIGVGSLLVQEQIGDETVQGNMMVPIDLLAPILEDMLRQGMPDRPPRPWLGLYAAEVGGHTVVAGLAGGGPAERAALVVGDRLLEVAGERVAGLADLYRKVWRVGSAGCDVPITIWRSGEVHRLSVRSTDRNALLKKPHLH